MRLSVCWLVPLTSIACALTLPPGLSVSQIEHLVASGAFNIVQAPHDHSLAGKAAAGDTTAGLSLVVVSALEDSFRAAQVSAFGASGCAGARFPHTVHSLELYGLTTVHLLQHQRLVGTKAFAFGNSASGTAVEHLQEALRRQEQAVEMTPIETSSCPSWQMAAQ